MCLELLRSVISDRVWSGTGSFVIAYRRSIALSIDFST